MPPQIAVYFVQLPYCQSRYFCLLARPHKFQLVPIVYVDTISEKLVYRNKRILIVQGYPYKYMSLVALHNRTMDVGQWALLHDTLIDLYTV